MTTWFYWQKTITSRWAPVKSDRAPSKPHGGWHGEVKGLVELAPDQEDWPLTKLMSFYPLDEPAPDEVSATEAPRKTMAELAAEISEAETRYCFNTIRHVKSGGEYVITGAHFREHDMALSVEYSPVDEDGYHKVYFSRSIDEMAFGTRFVFTGGIARGAME